MKRQYLGSFEGSLNPDPPRDLITETAEAIAQMAEARSKHWVANGVRLAAGQGDPFPAFAAEIRAKFGSRKMTAPDIDDEEKALDAALECWFRNDMNSDRTRMRDAISAYAYLSSYPERDVGNESVADYQATAHALASDLGFAGNALHQSRIRKEIAGALAEAAADMRERCEAIIQRHTEMANAEVAHTLTIVADAIAESAEAPSRSGHAELVAALEKIALRKPWLGRENYSRDDEGLLEYWSDLAKEFQSIARAALAAAGHAQKEPT